MPAPGASLGAAEIWSAKGSNDNPCWYCRHKTQIAPLKMIKLFCLAQWLKMQNKPFQADFMPPSAAGISDKYTLHDNQGGF